MELWIIRTQLEILSAFASIESLTVSIECFFPPISVTGANIYLIGAVVTVTCVFYTLVVSDALPVDLCGHNLIFDCFSGWNQGRCADGCLASDCYVYFSRCVYWNGHIRYRRL